MSDFGIEVRKRLADYAEGRLSLEDLEAWFVPRAWEVEGTRTPDAELVQSIGLRLAEFSGGHWSEQELKEALHLLGQTYWLPSSFIQKAEQTGSSTPTVTREVLQTSFSAAGT